MPAFSFATSGGSVTSGSTVVTGGTTGSVLFVGAASVLQQDNTNFFWDDTNNRHGLLTAVPTHTLTFGSTSTGVALYNTADQVTNFERVIGSWSTNIFSILTGKGGTGTDRDIRIGNGSNNNYINVKGAALAALDTLASVVGSGTTHFSFGRQATTFYTMWVGGSASTTNYLLASNATDNLYNVATAGEHQFLYNNAAYLFRISLANGCRATVTNSASSGTFTPFYINPTLTQSGTAGYAALSVDVVESSTGSGTKALGVFSVGAATRLSILNTGRLGFYSAVAVAGWGVPAIYSAGRSVAAVAAVASVATYTCGAADGSFIVDANVLVTTAGSANFTVTCAYTDEGNTARTATMTFGLVAGGVATTAVLAANGAVPYMGVPLHLRVKASTAITIATTGTFTGCTYNVEGNIRQIA